MITASSEDVVNLFKKLWGKTVIEDASWQVLDSGISGRGLFARRNIEAGEVILREQALLRGPTANLSYNLATCCVCFCHLEGSDAQIVCKNGCSMPVCGECSTRDKHVQECQLLREWQPKDTKKPNRHSVRLLCLIRCCFLNDLQFKILQALQANTDKYYLLEIQKAADCFQKFPPEKLKLFYQIACVFNTNTFEGRSCVENHEVLIRALFPLAALLNHQCSPNANHHFENGHTLVVTAVRPISQGEEIVTSYTKLFWGTLARKVFLAVTKKFICTCKRCSDPTVSGCSGSLNKKKNEAKL